LAQRSDLASFAVPFKQLHPDRALADVSVPERLAVGTTLVFWAFNEGCLIVLVAPHHVVRHLAVQASIPRQANVVSCAFVGLLDYFVVNLKRHRMFILHLNNKASAFQWQLGDMPFRREGREHKQPSARTWRWGGSSRLF
jgi:hypothetical protein